MQLDTERRPKRKGAKYATFNYETEKTDCCDAFTTGGGDGGILCRWCYQEVQGVLR